MCDESDLGCHIDTDLFQHASVLTLNFQTMSNTVPCKNTLMTIKLFKKPWLTYIREAIKWRIGRCESS